MSIIPLSADSLAYLQRTSADYEDEALPERDPRYRLPGLEECATTAEVTRAHLLETMIGNGLTAHQALDRLTRLGY